MKSIIYTIIIFAFVYSGAEQCLTQTILKDENEVNSYDLIGKKILQFGIDLDFDKYGYSYSRSRADLKANAKFLNLPSLTVTYGLSEKIDISYFTSISAILTKGNVTILLNQQRTLTASKNVLGIGTSGFGIKYGILSENRMIPSINIEGDFSMPFLGTPLFRPDNLGLDLIFNFHNTFSDLFDLSWSVGNSWSGFDTDPYATQQYSFNPGFTVNDKFYANINLFGYFNRKYAPLNKFSLGISYDFNDNISTELSGGSSFNKTNKYYFLGLSGTFLIDFNK